MARRVGSYLNSSPSLVAAVNEARRSAAVRAALQSALPPALARACTPITRGDRIVLTVPNGAVGAKLRQLLPSLGAAMRTRGFEITAISVEVQARSPVPRRLKPELSETASDALETFAESLPASPLKAALRRLAKRKP